MGQSHRGRRGGGESGPQGASDRPAAETLGGGGGLSRRAAREPQTAERDRTSGRLSKWAARGLCRSDRAAREPRIAERDRRSGRLSKWAVRGRCRSDRAAREPQTAERDRTSGRLSKWAARGLCRSDRAAREPQAAETNRRGGSLSDRTERWPQPVGWNRMVTAGGGRLPRWATWPAAYPTGPKGLQPVETGWRGRLRGGVGRRGPRGSGRVAGYPCGSPAAQRSRLLHDTSTAARSARRGRSAGGACLGPFAVRRDRPCWRHEDHRH